MADDISVRQSFQLRKADSSVVQLDARSPGPSGYSDDVSGTGGPSPGRVLVPFGGVVVAFAHATPGWCAIKNHDGSLWFDVGVYDPDSPHTFYPLCEVGPGMVEVMKLSRNLQEQFIGTGTGTASSGSARLMLKAHDQGADIEASVEAYPA